MRVGVHAIGMVLAATVVAACGAIPPTTPQPCTAARAKAVGGRVDTLFNVVHDPSGIKPDTLRIGAIVYDCRPGSSKTIP